jgi:hypothetical protein
MKVKNRFLEFGVLIVTIVLLCLVAGLSIYFYQGKGLTVFCVILFVALVVLALKRIKNSTSDPEYAYKDWHQDKEINNLFDRD